MAATTLRTCILGCLLGVVACLPAQRDNYRALAENAERARRQGRFRDAAEGYAAAFALKPGKEELAAEAAELFALVHDYEGSATYLATLAPEVGDFPRAGLALARVLKQLGRYEAAAAALKTYRERYRGDDEAEVAALVAREVEGLRLARAEAASPSGERRLRPLGPGVNDRLHQLAPMPLAPGAVYYVSEQPDGDTEVWRAARGRSTYDDGSLAEQFPAVPAYAIGAGTLGPTGDRFYLGLCDRRDPLAHPTSTCGLYVIIRGADGTWGRPRALPEYINIEGTTATQPFAYREGDREVILFASDRPGGLGGLDLYRTEREVTSEANDFTFPTSLGEVVNSDANEATPFYDAATRTLYFASDDGGGLGGYDLYRARGGGEEWAAPENLLAPINSPADDYGYRGVPERDEAVMASNRPLPGDSTGVPGDFNLFAVVPGAPTTPVALSVLDSVTGLAIPNVVLTVRRDGERVTTARAEDGYFRVHLPLGLDVELTLEAPDYRPRTLRARTPARPSRSFQLPPVKLGRARLSLREVRDREAGRGGAVDERVAVELDASTKPPSRAADLSYRIQVEARLQFDADSDRYGALAELGSMSHYRRRADGLTRVFVGDYARREEAAAGLDRAEAAGFPGAFIVEFAGGEYRGVSQAAASSE